MTLSQNLSRLASATGLTPFVETPLPEEERVAAAILTPVQLIYINNLRAEIATKLMQRIWNAADSAQTYAVDHAYYQGQIEALTALIEASNVATSLSQ